MDRPGRSATRRRATRTELCSAKKIGAHDVVRADDPHAGEQIIADTFPRFKGLERPWILVTELSLGKRKYDVRMHVALTRATLGCAVVAAAIRELPEDEKLDLLSERASSGDAIDHSAPVPEWHKEELDRRLATADADSFTSWSEARARILGAK